MTFRRLAILLVLALCSIEVVAQNLTNVQATVLDPNGIPYSNGTIIFTLGPLPFSSTPSLPTTPITPVPPTAGPFGLSANGVLNINLPSNAAITPGSTQWTATVCPNPNVPLPLGTGSGCFTASAITISGSSQDISTTLNASALALARQVNIDRLYATLPTAGTASITATTMVTAPAQPSAGTSYRLSAYASQTVLGASCGGNSTIVVNAIFQDPNAAAPQTQAIATFTVTTNGTLGIVPQTTNTGNPLVFRAKASTVVQFSTTFTANGACAPAPTVQIYPVLEAM